MARHRKFRHHKKGLLPKTMGGWIGFAFKVFGGVTMAAPGIGAVASVLPGGSQAGQYQNLGSFFLWNYFGLGSNGQINATQMGTGVGALAGGAALIFLGKWIGKKLR